MVPQQADYQFKWLQVFEHSSACPFAICPAPSATPTLAVAYLLSALFLPPFSFFGYWLSAIGYFL